METLFSFELLVETVRMEKGTSVSEERLAVALRLLDFPTLVVHGNERAFNRGKACFFKMNLDVLHRRLTSAPLYAMVLGVNEDVPKLIGTSLVSLAKVMDKLKRDASERGVSTPSSHGRRGTVGISNLQGEKVGCISLSYKLLSLGSSLIPRMNDKVDSANVKGSLKGNISKREADELHLNSENVQKSERGEGGKLSDNDECKIAEAIPKKCQEIDNYREEELSVFCPPQLYYKNTAKERREHEEESRKLLESSLNQLKCEDADDEVGTSLHLKEQRPNATGLMEEKQQVSAGDVTPNVIGQALRQMPLLNALLVELSQLNSPSASQPLTVHPSLSWIYRPLSAESTAVERKQQSQNESKSKRVASPKSKDLYSPRHCSTPMRGERKSTPRKKLVYGSTKSFHLRLKQNSPVAVKQRECVELLESKTQHRTSKEESKRVKKLTKSAKKSAQSSNLTENIETMMQNITVASTPRESITENQRNMDIAATPTEAPHGDTSVSEKSSPIESPSSLRRVPANVERGNGAKINQSSPDGHAGKCPGRRSGRSSAGSSLSGRSGGEEDYADDFNSLDTSDVFSPDPASPSPELRRPKTPSDLGRSSNSSPDNVQKNRRPLIPVPIKASRSPQRALRGTYTVPRQHFGVSCSSEDRDTSKTSSKLSACLGKYVEDGGREERSSGDSLRSLGDCRSESKSRQSIKRFSDESSFEHETEEEGELGTLDFKKDYKHISELVAHKLPGYTM